MQGFFCTALVFFFKSIRFCCFVRDNQTVKHIFYIDRLVIFRVFYQGVYNQTFFHFRNIFILGISMISVLPSCFQILIRINGTHYIFSFSSSWIVFLFSFISNKASLAVFKSKILFSSSTFFDSSSSSLSAPASPKRLNIFFLTSLNFSEIFF